MSRIYKIEQDLQDFARFRRIRALVHRRGFGLPWGFDASTSIIVIIVIIVIILLGFTRYEQDMSRIYKISQDFTGLGLWCTGAVLACHGDLMHQHL